MSHSNKHQRTDLLRMLEEGRREVLSFPLDRIVVLDGIHVRRSLDPAQVNRYAGVYSHGWMDMPPLTLAKMEQARVLIDGFYRFHAMKKATGGGVRGFCDPYDVPTAQCHIVGHKEGEREVTLEEARYLSYYLNRANGTGLNKKEMREGWRRYFEAEMYRLSGGRKKSLREIGAEFGIPHQTVARFVRKNFPRLIKLWTKEARHMESGNNPEGFNGMCRGNKSIIASGEICDGITAMLGKRQFVKRGTPEEREVRCAVLKLLLQWHPEYDPCKPPEAIRGDIEQLSAVTGNDDF